MCELSRSLGRNASVWLRSALRFSSRVSGERKKVQAVSQGARWKATLHACLASAAVLSSVDDSVAGELVELGVREADGEYSLRIVALLDAPADYVYRVITDYRHAYRINPAITSIEILPAGHDGVTQVKNHSAHRVGVFTFEIEWAGDIAEAGEGRLEITTIPELSSFESGSALWEIRPEGDRTRVLHESTLKPEFYILPVIGDYLLKKYMEGETLDTFHRIECNARILLESDMRDDSEGLQVLLNEGRDCLERHVYEASQDPGQR
jgi:hypothetical protein